MFTGGDRMKKLYIVLILIFLVINVIMNLMPKYTVAYNMENLVSYNVAVNNGMGIDFNLFSMD
ncbi:MAG: hypothetical protein PWP66_533 [Thermosediminibacterales bacterium]|jgi:hypothetical protein|nr:hypothetical protein [Thermosediminibacterales bacterium]NPV44894.1 hypothetical protein [Bacillota bacterium]